MTSNSPASDALKAWLAVIRGFGIGDFRAEFAKMMQNGPEEYAIQTDDQQAAAYLQTARVFYRSVPELVVFESEELDDFLAKLAE